MKTAVIGAGSWGTTLADLLASEGNEVVLWAYEEEVASEINTEHTNSLFLPEIVLESSLYCTVSLEEALDGAGVLLTVCPSHVLRSLMERMAPYLRPGVTIVSASKGIETGSLMRMSEVIADCLPQELTGRIAALSGPSFAFEVARRRPTVITVASEDEETAGLVQRLFSTSYFRVYKHYDLRGVELGGALKNVIAIATGMVEGRGLGMNTRAALITRGLAEITRLGESLGARAETFSGTSGLGDLVLTCTGDLSRNRQVGLRIGRGETLDEIAGGARTVAEGIRTTRSAHALARRQAVEMPITEQTYRILFEEQTLDSAIAELMGRGLKKEYE